MNICKIVSAYVLKKDVIEKKKTKKTHDKNDLVT